MTITLATLPQATAQEVYNHVARHLLTQKERSTNCGAACMYRGNFNLKCAAGCLISDDEYSPDMEDTGWQALIREKVVPRKHGALIQELQNIHDNINPDEWQAELDLLAKHKRLKKFRLESA